jgi:hypothetical protein
VLRSQHTEATTVAGGPSDSSPVWEVAAEPMEDAERGSRSRRRLSGLGRSASAGRRSVRGMSDIDARIDDKIDALETERERLRGREASDDADELRTRLEEIRVELDRLFDWRRQRRALSAAGQDPDAAHERDASVVERYLQ